MQTKFLKQCSRCKLDKTFDNFNKDPRYRDGYASYCKQCRREYQQEQMRIPEKRRQRTEYGKRYHQEHWEHEVTRRRQYDKEQWKNNPQLRERKNRQKAESIERRKDDPAFIAKRKGWADAANQRHRARTKRGKVHYVQVHFTPEEWHEMCKKYDYRCLCCGRREPEIQLTQDHVIPLSHGGSNSIDNIQPLCKQCNRKKYTGTTDYRPRQGVSSSIPPDERLF